MGEIGTKYDEEKLRWDLVPWKEFEEVVKVITKGAEKYEDNNWQKVEPKNRYFAALMRHVVEYIKGERDDDEWGIPHLAHVACNCLFLMWKDNQTKGLWKDGPVEGHYDGVEMGPVEEIDECVDSHRFDEPGREDVSLMGVART